MILLRRTLLQSFSRKKYSTASIEAKIYAEALTERNLIRVHGDEASQFLQGLITNDIKHLTRAETSMYTMFLNTNGRVLYDSIIYRSSKENTFLIECDKNISNDLQKYLKLFRVRKKIDIDSINQEFSPWVLFGTDKLTLNLSEKLEENDIMLLQDPRSKLLGKRLLLPAEYEFSDIKKLINNSENIFQTNENFDYKLHRYKLGIGEGILDHPPSKCLPLETNLDYLHGVSFYKGCYIGQELTARTYHTLVIRKRYMPVILEKTVKDECVSIQNQAGKIVGTIKGRQDNYALASIRLDQALNEESLMIDGYSCKIITPSWWPKEMPHSSKLKDSTSGN